MDYVATTLAAIFPSQRSRMLYCSSRLTETHFAINTQARTLWKLALAYFNKFADVPTPQVVKDVLEKNFDSGQGALLWQMYVSACNTSVSDAEFKYAVEGLLEREAHHRTGEAMAVAYEILENGYTLPDGDTLKGHDDMRAFLEARLAEIGRAGLVDAAPEGDLRLETDQLLREYEQRKKKQDGTGISTGLPSIDKSSGGIMVGDLAMLAAYTSQGKASPLSTPVLTPTGWRKIGDLITGDAVVDPTTGRPQIVTQTHDRGVMDTYRVTTRDGGSALVGADHLWLTQDQNQRAGKVKTPWTVRSTEELQRGLNKGQRFYLPVSQPVHFTPLEEPLAVPAYAMGALLGDGCVAEGVCNPSWEKSIPARYLRSTVADRWELLKGLLDTDGFVSTQGQVVFASSSEQLTRDVRELVMSLGGTTSRIRVKQPYYSKDGGRVECRPSYVVTIHTTQCPFALPRKIERWETPPVRTSLRAAPHRTIQSVEFVGSEEVRCISVSGENHLYITEDYLVTHNSQLCVNMAWNAAIKQKKNVYYGTSETARSDIINRFVARHSKLAKFNFAEGLNHSKIRRGELTPDEEKILHDVLDDLKGGEYGAIEIQQLERGSTLNNLEHRMLAKHHEFGIDIAFCDYLNLLAPTTRRTTQREEASDLIKDAKTLATSFGGSGVPFVTPWQVSRAAWEKAQAQQGYDLSALAEASEAEKSADLVLTLMYDYKLSPKTATAQLIKCRNGELVPKINLDVDYKCAFFQESGSGMGSSATVLGTTTGLPGLHSSY